MRTGYATLPLHGGKAPAWLFSRMARLARDVVRHLVAEYGPPEVLRRLADPFWFQALGCALGFDWHSSGVTTTTCGALKEDLRGLEHELGVFVCGGKGAVSRQTPQEIARGCERLGRDPSALVEASRLSAKVDSAALQDGYALYHHAFFFTADGHWCVVQQGMNETDRSARRYHWLGENLASFVVEPHAAVCCDRRAAAALNLVAAESAAARDAVTAIAAHPDREVARTLARLPELVLPRRHRLRPALDVDPRYVSKILLRTYERAPRDFAQLLGIEGVGAKTLRALALLAKLVYGTPASTRDPARFAFAHGGKDGTPFPVDRRLYDRTIAVLHEALEQARGVERHERVAALERLARFGARGRRTASRTDLNMISNRQAVKTAAERILERGLPCPAVEFDHEPAPPSHHDGRRLGAQIKHNADRYDTLCCGRHKAIPVLGSNRCKPLSARSRIFDRVCRHAVDTPIPRPWLHPSQDKYTAMRIETDDPPPAAAASRGAWSQTRGNSDSRRDRRYSNDMGARHTHTFSIDPLSPPDG